MIPDRMEEQEGEEHPAVVESKIKKAEATGLVRRNNILTFSVESERSFCKSRFHKCIILILPKTEHLISSVNKQLIRAKQPASPIFHHMPILRSQRPEPRAAKKQL